MPRPAPSSATQPRGPLALRLVEARGAQDHSGQTSQRAQLLMLTRRKPPHLASLSETQDAEHLGAGQQRHVDSGWSIRPE